LADDADFGEHLAVVEHQRGHVALRVYLPVVAAIGGFLLDDIDFFKFEGVAGFQSDDVRRHRAGAR